MALFVRCEHFVAAQIWLRWIENIFEHLFTFPCIKSGFENTWDLKSLWKYSILLEIKALIQLIGFCISQNSERRSNKRIMSMLKRSSSLKKLPSNLKGKFLKNYRNISLLNSPSISLNFFIHFFVLCYCFS